MFPLPFLWRSFSDIIIERAVWPPSRFVINDWVEDTHRRYVASRLRIGWVFWGILPSDPNLVCGIEFCSFQTWRMEGSRSTSITTTPVKIPLATLIFSNITCMQFATTALLWMFFKRFQAGFVHTAPDSSTHPRVLRCSNIYVSPYVRNRPVDRYQIHVGANGIDVRYFDLLSSAAEGRFLTDDQFPSVADSIGIRSVSNA